METIARIEDKLDKIAERQGEMAALLAVQAEQLKEHMRRTALLEEALGPIRDQVKLWKGIIAVLLAVPSTIAALKWFIK